MNTTDVTIVTFCDKDAVDYINIITGLQLMCIHDGLHTGPTSTTSCSVYAGTYRSLGLKRIEELVTAFKQAHFDFPELASLTINDDNTVFNGVITRTI